MSKREKKTELPKREESGKRTQNGPSRGGLVIPQVDLNEQEDPEVFSRNTWLWGVWPGIQCRISKESIPEKRNPELT